MGLAVYEVSDRNPEVWWKKERRWCWSWPVGCRSFFQQENESLVNRRKGRKEKTMSLRSTRQFSSKGAFFLKGARRPFKKKHQEEIS
jgi:hypothetical protein